MVADVVADFEGMVKLIHDDQIKGADERVEKKEQELIDAQTQRHMLRQDDSKARTLAQALLDMAKQIPIDK